MGNKIIIEPVSRVEGHGKVTVTLNDAGRAETVHLHVTQVRGFEKFCEGRLYNEMLAITPRICGICPVSHHLAAAKACDEIMGVELTPTATMLRRLLHYAQILQSHALHFFYLASPDLLFGMESDPANRNIIGVIAAQPELARKGIHLRSFGQQIIESLGEKKIHPNAAIPGGMNRALSQAERQKIADGIDLVIADSLMAVNLVKDYLAKNKELADNFGAFDSSYMGLVDKDNNVEYYDGMLRLKATNGVVLEDKFAPKNYLNYIEEQVEDWTYLKFPYYKKFGYPGGMYRVGPLGRFNAAEGHSTPLANREFREARKMSPNGILQGSLYYHLARMIEMLNAAEKIKELVQNEAICGTDIWVNGSVVNTEGVGVIEAPRGTLIHHYKVDKSGKIVKVNLIVSTGHNNLAMNRAIYGVARYYIKDGKVTEGILNRIEVAIRCYDPCLSCSTHALGHMPLELTVVNPDGSVREVLSQ
jgi:NAD-reducing hydrogenase large subunit